MNERSFQSLLPTPPPAPENDIVLDFGKIFNILRRHWWVIVGAGIGGAAIAAIMVLQVDPTFSGRSQLLMGQQSRPSGTLDNLVQDLNLDDDAISGEIAIITSGRILSKVSAKLDLASRPDFNPELRPPEPEPLVIVRLANLAVDSLKRMAGLTPSSDAPLPPSEGGDFVPNPIGTAAQIGKESLGEQAPYVGVLVSGLRVRRVGNTNLVDVQFLSTDRLLAAAVPNTVVDIYLEDQLNRKFEALRRLTEGLQSRLANMRERLEASERAVIDYRNRNLEEGFGGQTLLKQHLADLSRRMSQASAEQAELVSEVNGINAIIEARGETAAAGLFQSPLIERMRSDIIELQQRRALLIDRLGPDSTQVRDVDDEIARLDSMIAAEVLRLRNDLLNRAELGLARVNALRQELAALESRAIAQAEREVRLTQLERDHAAEQAVYATFLDKFTQASESVNLQEGDAQIIAYANPPSAPIAPDKKVAVALGGIAGGFAGTGLVFLLARIDTRIREKSQLQELMRGGHVIALPRMRRFPLRGVDPLAVAEEEPLGPMSEAVRSIRSHVMLSAKRGTGQVVTMVSPRADAGKTTTGLLLTRSLAQMGVSCVLVDADLRRAPIAGRLGLPVQPDLVDVLSGTVPLEVALRDDPGSRARILTARKGLADPAGTLLSDAMENLVQQLRQQFRVVILDTAPLTPVSDAAPMVKLADNVMLLVRCGTPARDVENGLETLDKLGVTRVLPILSMAPGKPDKMYEQYTSA